MCIITNDYDILVRGFGQGFLEGELSECSRLVQAGTQGFLNLFPTGRKEPQVKEGRPNLGCQTARMCITESNKNHSSG